MFTVDVKQQYNNNRKKIGFLVNKKILTLAPSPPPPTPYPKKKYFKELDSYLKITLAPLTSPLPPQFFF